MEQVAAAVDAETNHKLREYIRALLRIYDKMPIRGICRTVIVSPPINDQHAIHRLVYWITRSENASVEYVASLNSVPQHTSHVLPNPWVWEGFI